MYPYYLGTLFAPDPRRLLGIILEEVIRHHEHMLQVDMVGLQTDWGMGNILEWFRRDDPESLASVDLFIAEGLSLLAQF